MEFVLQLEKELTGREALSGAPTGVLLRHYRGQEDIGPFLALREAAFQGEELGVRPWSERDFEREFLLKPWWRPERMWLAERSAHDGSAAPTSTPIGTVTMALRGSGPAAVPVVHWLCVHPRARRLGIGRLLLAALERTAWEAGFRTVALETHVRWRAANRLYEAHGFCRRD